MLYETLQKLKDGKIQFEDLSDLCFFDPDSYFRIQTKHEKNILDLLNNDICSFKQIVDKYKKLKDNYNNVQFCNLLRNRFLFEELLQNNLLTTEDLKYLLNEIDDMGDFTEPERFCENTPLIKKMLVDFIFLDEKILNRFNAAIESYSGSFFKHYDIHTTFDLFNFWAKHSFNNDPDSSGFGEWDKQDEEFVDKKMLELIDLNKKMYECFNKLKLTEIQRNELIEVLTTNETAKNRLIQLIETHLKDDYDFDSLMNYLKKPEKKTVFNI